MSDIGNVVNNPAEDASPVRLRIKGRKTIRTRAQVAISEYVHPYLVKNTDMGIVRGILTTNGISRRKLGTKVFVYVQRRPIYEREIPDSSGMYIAKYIGLNTADGLVLKLEPYTKSKGPARKYR